MYQRQVDLSMGKLMYLYKVLEIVENIIGDGVDKAQPLMYTLRMGSSVIEFCLTWFSKTHPFEAHFAMPVMHFSLGLAPFSCQYIGF